MTHWQTDYLSHPLYQPIRTVASLLSLDDWPTQQDYDQLLQRARAHAPTLATRLRFVCDLIPDSYYEQHIAAHGEVPTRSRNWHDWFNALSWLAWPHSKQALNERHLRAIANGEKRRGPRRDAATLLDECGVIVAISDDAIGQLLQQMQWQALFITQRQSWQQQISVHTLGHALFESGLAPYIGWCGKALLLHVNPDFFSLAPQQQQQQLDQQLARQLADDHFLSSPLSLCPLPLLGIPGWYPPNEDPSFYLNHHYFRPTRRAKSCKELLAKEEVNDPNSSATPRLISST
ncbi:DUF3025 domain-containing protein [Neisseriaceae bacterium TC5R-5]|nr:DUF3025 domain-containing protein [Neisseriaceae bacterium TC5R-5]